MDTNTDTGHMAIPLYFAFIRNLLNCTGQEFASLDPGAVLQYLTCIVSFSPIHSTSLEMSEVSSDAAILLIRVPQQNDTAIVISVL